MVTAYNKLHGSDLALFRSSLRLSVTACHAQFLPLLDKIVNHLQTLLNMKELSDVKFIFVVGGFGESSLLQDHLKKKLNTSARMIVPPRPGHAVIIGAVKFGLNPNVIISRIAKCTFGIDMKEIWNDEQHCGGKRATHDGQIYCENVFDVFIRTNESIDLRSEVVRTYTPVEESQTTVELPVYSSEKPYPRFTTDAGVEYVGCLKMDIPPGSNRQIRVVMQFGGPTFSVRAYLEGKSDLHVKAEFNFHLGMCSSADIFGVKTNSSPLLGQAKRPTPTIMEDSSLDVCIMMVRSQHKLSLLGSSVHTFFLYQDCTGSMGSWIDQTNKEAMNIAQAIRTKYPLIQVRYSFVGYRDIQDAQRFEVVPFTTSMNDIFTQIKGISATG